MFRTNSYWNNALFSELTIFLIITHVLWRVAFRESCTTFTAANLAFFRQCDRTPVWTFLSKTPTQDAKFSSPQLPVFSILWVYKVGFLFICSSLIGKQILKQACSAAGLDWDDKLPALQEMVRSTVQLQELLFSRNPTMHKATWISLLRWCK